MTRDEETAAWYDFITNLFRYIADILRDLFT